MATRLVSKTLVSQPTGEPDPSEAPEEDLPQDDLILEFNIIIWLLVGLAGFFFLLRAYCKITRQRGLWWDDHVIGAAWVRLALESPYQASIALRQRRRMAVSAGRTIICRRACH